VRQETETIGKLIPFAKVDWELGTSCSIRTQQSLVAYGVKPSSMLFAIEAALQPVDRLIG